jgi:hypothetical protein
MEMQITHPEEVRALRSSRERVAALLARYPKISSRDRREILDFLKTGRHLEIGLLTANAALRPRLDSFMADHNHHFRVTLAESARVLAAISAFLLVCWLLWELIGPAQV